MSKACATSAFAKAGLLSGGIPNLHPVVALVHDEEVSGKAKANPPAYLHKGESALC